MGNAFKPYLGARALGDGGRRRIPRRRSRCSTSGPGLPPAWWLAIAAGVFALIDWAESAQNFTIAARGDVAAATRLPRLHLLDARARCRAVPVRCGRRARPPRDRSAAGRPSPARRPARHQSTPWCGTGSSSRSAPDWASAWASCSIISTRAHHRRLRRIVILAAVIGPLISSAVILLAIDRRLRGLAIRRPGARHRLPVKARRSQTAQRFAGLLLLLQLALIYFVNALSWAGRPMARAHLGSIVRLQVRTSPRQVKECLDRWCSMLQRASPQSSGCRMRRSCGRRCTATSSGSSRSTPLVFTFGLWFGASQLGWTWLKASGDRAADGGHRRLRRGHLPPPRVSSFTNATSRPRCSSRGLPRR